MESMRIFSAPDPKLPAAFPEAGRLVQAHTGTTLFRQGERAERVYLLREGQVKLTQLTEDGAKVLLDWIAPGEVFGVLCLLLNGTHSMTAEAVRDSTAWCWEGETFLRLIMQDQELRRRLLRGVAGIAMDRQDRYRELAHERVEQRLARTLVRLSNRFGRAGSSGLVIEAPLSREELAQMSGTTMYTASRTLSRWEQHGLVRSGRRKVTIRDMNGLKAVSMGHPEPQASEKRSAHRTGR